MITTAANRSHIPPSHLERVSERHSMEQVIRLRLGSLFIQVHQNDLFGWMLHDQRMPPSIRPSHPYNSIFILPPSRPPLRRQER
jgi:hypothetical protein